jgi:pilus assembly protein CpaB
MRRGRIFIFIALILIIGLAVVALVFRQFLSPAPSDATPPPATVKIYVAGQNVPQGGIIVEDVLDTMEIPQDKVVSVMYTTDRKSELVGKTAKYPIDQGVVITSPMVSDGTVAAGGPEWGPRVPEGMTAIAIPTTRLESVAFGVRDGAHVGVSACLMFVDVDPSFQTELPNHVSELRQPGVAGEGEVPGVTLGVSGDLGVQGRTEVESAFQQGIYVIPSEPQQRPRLVCQMVLQHAVVLKLGEFPFEQPQVTSPEGEQPQSPEEQAAQQAPALPDVVTLIVSPQDSITLSYLVYSGAKITLALRNPTDDSRVATEAATLQFLLSQYNIPVPAKLPYAMQPRIDDLDFPFLPNDVVTIPPEQ